MNGVEVSMEKNDCYQILGPFCLIFGDDFFRQPLDVRLEGIIHLHVGLVLAQRARFGVEISIDQQRLVRIAAEARIKLFEFQGEKKLVVTYLASWTSSPARFLRSASKRSFRASETAARDIVESTR